jgi:ArsR family transcriptional regulator, arsenate/arsenite/antimonite-responsive transcriptional repressor
MKSQPLSTRSPAPDLLAQRLRALAHPTRLRILAALAENNTCHCGDIVRDLPLAQSTVSEHLRILRAAGLVRGETTDGRPCYCLDRAAVRKLGEDFERQLAAIARAKTPAAKRAARKGQDKAAERI